LTERFDITLTINGNDYEVRAEARRTLVASFATATD
jgi:hypothetical protein